MMTGGLPVLAADAPAGTTRSNVAISNDLMTLNQSLAKQGLFR